MNRSEKIDLLLTSGVLTTSKTLKLLDLLNDEIVELKVRISDLEDKS